MKRLVILQLLFVVLLLTGTLLAEQDNGRIIMDFNHDWLFEQDDWVGLNNASHWDWKDSHWIKIQTPHSYNADDSFDNVRWYYRGYAWYRKHFTVPAEHKGRRIFICFGAISNQSEIWVNEQYMGKFNSGFTPIEIDVTDVLNWDSENLISVRVNNIHNDEIPPGRWRMDYNVYGGIYREVTIESLSDVYLEKYDLFATTPVVNEKESVINTAVKVSNTSQEYRTILVRTTVLDGAQEKSVSEQSITIPPELTRAVSNLESIVKNVKLWSPDQPNLYLLNVELFENNQLIDQLKTKIGFRSFEFTANKGLLFNGKPLKTKGINRHQCYPGLANAVPKRLQVQDAVILKDLGVNFVRCSHYPQHPDFLNACDSLGILVYEEPVSWQHIGGREFMENMDYMFDAMLRRDRNHPSIILWGLMNEGRSAEMFKLLQATADRLDSTRPTCYAENHIKEALEQGTAFIPDILALNYKIEAYDELHKNYPELILISSECTNPDKTYIGDYTSEMKSFASVKQDLDLIESKSYLPGACIWGFHDYGSEYKPVWPIQTSGVVDYYRRYKEPAWYIKARWSKEPFVHIAGTWDNDKSPGEPVNVNVWHNGDKVDLYLNGKKIQSSKEKECEWNVPFEPGKLKAVAKQGREQVEHVLITPGDPAAIQLTALSNEMFADGYDAIPVTAQLVDADGNPVHVNGVEIAFESTNGGKIIGIGGAKSAESADGSAVVLVQSTGKSGNITVTAKAKALKGSCEIISR